MTVVIDTSSLLSLAHYYLPFDDNDTLKDLITEKVIAREIIILDKVYDECRSVRGGTVIQQLSCVEDKSNHTKTDSIIPLAKFHRIIDNNLMRRSLIKSKNLSDQEVESEKQKFIQSADGKLILYTYYKDNNAIIVTEETASANDGKLFKKIPNLCAELGLTSMSLPDLLSQYPDLSIEFSR